MIEKDLEKWFEKNYKTLGFDKIEPNKKYNWQMQEDSLKRLYLPGGQFMGYPYWLKGKGEMICPDYFGYKKGKKYGIELEVKSSNFIAHKHNPEIVDFLLVFEDDSKKFKDFPIPRRRIIKCQYSDKI